MNDQVIIGAEICAVTYEGKHDTDVEFFSSYEKALAAKAEWYRTIAEPDELPSDDQEAVDAFEEAGGDYRAWINSGKVQ